MRIVIRDGRGTPITARLARRLDVVLVRSRHNIGRALNRAQHALERHEVSGRERALAASSPEDRYDAQLCGAAPFELSAGRLEVIEQLRSRVDA